MRNPHPELEGKDVVPYSPQGRNQSLWVFGGYYSTSLIGQFPIRVNEMHVGMQKSLRYDSYVQSIVVRQVNDSREKFQRDTWAYRDAIALSQMKCVNIQTEKGRLKHCMYIHLGAEVVSPA